MPMQFKQPRFPTVDEIQQAVSEHVADNCGGEWPDDDWMDVGECWSCNIWEREGIQRITVYYDYQEGGYRTTDTLCGIDIPPGRSGRWWAASDGCTTCSIQAN